MRVLLLSPYHSGSHRAWAEAMARWVAAEFEVLSLPGRFWKWRMHGAAVSLHRRLRSIAGRFDVVVCTDMCDLGTFLGLARAEVASVPAVLYMHENQLLYPLPADPSTGPMRRQAGERDLHYAWVNYSSMVSADRIVFNSEYHRDALLRAIPGFIRAFPDERDLTSAEELGRKSVVLSPGIDLPPAAPRAISPQPPLVLWNQRWEFDKRPDLLFWALRELDLAGVDFRVAICGESARQRAPEFEEARRWLAPRVVQWGYVDRGRYGALLAGARVVVSTAEHEFFGISVAEAMASGACAVLPRRLSYPELVPEALHPECLYDEPAGLVSRLRRFLEDEALAGRVGAELRAAMEPHRWERLAPRYERLFSELVEVSR